MIWLRAFSRSRDGDGYPLAVPAVRHLGTLRFTAPITFLTGENGSGKTTLVELIAALSRAVRVDANAVPGDKTRAVAEAASAFKVEFARRPERCLYFHAEGFIRYMDQLQVTRSEARDALERLRTENPYGSEYARQLAAQPYAGTLSQLSSLYKTDITARSHGEGYLDFFGGRVAPNGLYLLDEPEAALSFFHQYVLLDLLRDAAAQGSQFIVSTHSPILTALPGAQLLAVSEEGVRPTEYGELPDVRFLRDFLASPRRYLREPD